MSWSFRLIRILGTDVKVHVTFVLLLAFFWAKWQVEGGVHTAALMTVLFLAVFLCVLAHEFGHILMARRFGIRTPDVILLPIGGVARLERMPEDPQQEFLIALAGPAVTLAIAAGLYLWLRLAGEPQVWPGQELGEPSLPQTLFYINVVLLFFNLIPAFPLDGGRVLRALLSTRMDHVRATRIAATIGQGFALIGGVLGLLNTEPMWVLIALFVFFSAGQEATLVETRAAGRGLSVDQMMVTRFVAIPAYATLRQAAETLLQTEQRDFPVINPDGVVEGLLTRDNLIRGLAQRGPDAPVSEVMTRPVATVPSGLGFEPALARLRASGLPALPVVNAAGRLVGLLTTDNVNDLMLVRQAGLRG
jgi:stage IV sporulation protein FB